MEDFLSFGAYLVLNFLRYFIAQVFQGFFSLISHVVGIVAGLDLRFALGIICGMGLSFCFHAINFGITQTRRCCDGDMLAAAGCFVLSCNLQDAVGVNIESNFDLRYAARRRGYPIQDEAAK